MRAWLALMLILPLAAAAQTSGFGENSGDRGSRGEVQVPLPAFPKPENYLPFLVSTTTPFAFFVDAKSIGVGADRVVQYSVIAKSADGALNISFEGMRCADDQFRVYAFGRPDNTWFEVRKSHWQAIRNDSHNAQRMVLHDDFFCPDTGDITTAEQGVRALKTRGKQRSIITSY